MATLPIIEREVVVETIQPANPHIICWKAILGGAVGAGSISVILLILGSGLGFASVSPWTSHGASATAFTVGAAIWLIITQWAASGIGGYLTGRLKKRSHINEDESVFIDTAHGFLAWSLATLFIVGLLGSAVSNIVGGGVKAGTVVAASAAAGHEAAKSDDYLIGYYADSLFRNNKNIPTGADTRGETSRILLKFAADDIISEQDKGYISALVVRQAGIEPGQANDRVNIVLNDIAETKAKAKQAADDAKKAATAIAIVTALSMFIGAFIAIVGAALGGRHRDEYSVN